MDKILITGGSGFIGTNLVEKYINNKIILNVDILEPRNKKHLPYWKSVDILDLEELKNTFKKFNPDFIFHMAARTDLDGVDLESYSANTVGVENLIEASKECKNLKKIIFASSRLVCKIGYSPKNMDDYCPINYYGESKIIGENIVKNSNEIPCDWTIVRPTSIWGPWFDVPYRNFFDTIYKGYFLYPGNKKIEKHFGYVENATYILNYLLRDQLFNQKVIYLSDFETTNLWQWANLISQNFGKSKIRKVPYWTLKIMAIIGDVMKKVGIMNAPPITSFRLNNLVTEMIYDLSKVKKEIGNLPYSIEESTKKTIKWMEKHLNQTNNQ
ncbi:NAD(P)-dependent oxidoreductase [Winogradskyella echinorum]|uniref:NAD(P)-dependent oxidoreductase n=1 Tax=Winogradskyella echinorum TaxID=538189 RepID=A0ABR6XZ85_9FLAO|nr:NAD(P)-dependent oxidoreductase [Winogradskyella echinorum]MBC3845734.1 NAD(P)-dependent oxidoreductase [Winogradskyella echinorum]MBC5750082.1 NAD(P)-dependent oxidoreductase [Winogradskyella echinorum]